MKLIRYLPRFQKADRALTQLVQHERWGRDQIVEFQLRAINRLWKHAIGSVPYYEHLCSQRRLPSQFNSLAQYQQSVPLLSKECIRDNPLAFRSRVKSAGFWCRTGGSTGTPMRMFWDRDAHHRMLCTKYHALQMFGIDYLDRTAYLWGHSTYFQNGWKGRVARLKQPVEDFCRNRLRLSAYRVAPLELKEYLTQLQRFRPVVLYGYPSALRLLAEEARKISFELTSLRHIIVTGEPADTETVTQIERAFSAPVAIEYGSVDCGHIAHQWPDGTLRVREDVQFLETDPQEEQPHRIVLTPLHNYSFPLLRYDLGDATSEPLHHPEIGFAVLKDVIGRSNDFLIGKDGGVSHSARIDALFKYQCKNIRRFHVHQKMGGEVEVYVELLQADIGSKLEIERHITELFVGLIGFATCVRVVDEIKLSRAGKHRLLISDYACEQMKKVSPS